MRWWSRSRTSWLTGRKTLVFVRRVASVTELEQKLNECYDAWLIPHLRARLPNVVTDRFNRIVEDYHKEKQTALEAASRRAGDEVLAGPVPKTTAAVQTRFSLGSSAVMDRRVS